MKSMNSTVCILYGLGEGPVIGKELIQKLEERGFEIITDASQATYIIAHSGGMLYVPQTYRAKLFLFTGVINKVYGSVVFTQYKKVQQDFIHAIRFKNHWYWLKKSFWNAFYLLREIKRTLYMWNFAHSDKPFIPTIQNAKVIIVTYKDDPWSDSLSKKELEKFPKYELIKHTGLHDDLWTNPDYYIKLLKTTKID